MLATPEGASQPEHRLETLRFSPNPEAQILADQIPGITFNQTPRKIEMDAGNTFALMKDPGLRAYLGISTRDLIAPKQYRKFKGVYIADYNLILVYGGERNPESHRVLSLHENMHGFIDQVNPNIGGYLRGRFTEYLGQGSLNFSQYHKAFAEKRTAFLDSLTPEEKTRLFSYQAISEGLAIWGSVEANMKIKGVQARKELMGWHKATLSDSDSPDLRPIITESPADQLGHFLVLYVLEDLIELGKTSGEAVKLVAKYPPDDMKVLWNHDVFAEELLAKERDTSS